MDPAGTDENYVEKTIRLPHTQLCYQPRDKCPDIAPPPSEQNGYVTFGCLNNFVKISPLAIELWGGVMQKVSNSRLLIHAAPGSQRRRVLERLQKFGVAADRIAFFDTSDWQTYMRAYSAVDIALDPIPYSGGVTTCDALWMGVPVITLAGQTAVGRAGASILSNIGLPEFVATTAPQYIQIATDLAGNRARLATLRREIRARMQSSPLMDAAGFARDIESAYKFMIASAGQICIYFPFPASTRIFAAAASPSETSSRLPMRIFTASAAASRLTTITVAPGHQSLPLHKLQKLRLLVNHARHSIIRPRSGNPPG